MNNDSNDYFDIMEDENPVQIKQLIGKYLAYWPWFLGTIVICLFAASFYLRYADVIYKTEAKVKLLTDKESANFSLDVSKLFNKSNINLENEIALFTSVHLAEQVVRNLNLNVVYYFSGSVTSKQVYNPPFAVSYAEDESSLNTILRYTIEVTSTGFTIVNLVSGKSYYTKGYYSKKSLAGLPIQILASSSQNVAASIGQNYRVIVKPFSLAATQLTAAVSVSSDGKDSDVLLIGLSGTNGSHSEKIINNLIEVFEADGITDKQLVSRRTINFVDDRFVYLQKDLDSIEKSKKEYKKNNDLSFIQGDAGASILSKSAKDEALFAIESQLLVVKLLEDNLKNQNVFELLPSNIGLESSSVNVLVSSYNSSVLEYQKLQTSAGKNNPSVQLLVSVLNNQRKNIIQSVKVYKQQLESSRAQSKIAQQTAEGSFSTIPEKEKVLRSIERQQNLKESLYLLLLQKREEASINLAVTVPNTKIIDYAITNNTPVSPQGRKIYLGALFLGFLIPFGVLFLIFKLDNKIHSANDVEAKSKNIPVLAEIPATVKYKDSVMHNEEAFRTLAQNTSFITPLTEDSNGKVLFVTSSIKGEGKTFVSYHLANSYANLDKRVLIVGTDFRNPQLHKYLDLSLKESKGLSNYLHESSLQWQDLVCKTKGNDFSFDVILAGVIPPNPTLLLSSSRFKNLIEEVKKEYDIIIFDTPPTLLVSDTLIISKFADTSLYVMRAGITEKNLITFSNKLAVDKKIINMGYVINDVNFNGGYGYGYGYGEEVNSKSWYNKSILGKLFAKQK
jgi:capsular exopolysaccharide synthesis family protein